MAILFYMLLVGFSFWGTTYVALNTQWALVLPVVIMFLLIPLLDELWKKFSQKRLTLNASSSTWLALIPFYTYFLLHFLSLALIIYSTRFDTSISLIFLKALASLMFNGGQCMVIAHELCHLPRRREKLMANLLLSSFLYGHFVLEHIQGHHVLAATELDPSSARYGESFWKFLPRTILGQLKSCYHIEKVNIEKKRWRLVSSFSFSIILALCFMALSFLLGGVNGIYFLLMHAVMSILLLEAGNYIVHYGLVRRLTNNKYEKFHATHSWSSDSPLTNLLLFNLPCHSSHHLSPQNNYLDLKHEEQSPCLPYSHFVMLFLSLFPPLWFKVMHPIVDKINPPE